jgi:hypothetical protein
MSSGTPVKVTETTTVEVKPERPDNWRTILLVGAVIATGIIYAAFALTGPRWGMFCLFLALYEGWTLLNAYKEDTISEAVWILARRPITVLLFGIAFGIAGGSGYLGSPVVVLRAFAIGLLYGHFFFTPIVATTVKTRKVRA